MRRHAVSHGLSWLVSDRRGPGKVSMPQHAAVAMAGTAVARHVKTSTTRRCHLSPAKLLSAKLSAEAFARAVRAHPNIESGVHRVLAVAFEEDRARTGKRCGGSDDFARSILGEMR
ncbi:MAG: hypothetical protein HWD60_20125 [Defluviicoccus sp.]|nr:MAG: hypothetical protein HWD60_20125 [Defluviicoccus sp.]